MPPRLKSKTPRAHPPGRVRITESLVSLLAEKEFSAVTTAEIARKAGVTEALIYKYFKDKRDLLHQVLKAFLEKYMKETREDLKGIREPLDKIRKLVQTHLQIYATDRVFARILLIEVRTHPDYFASETYAMVRAYTGFLLDFIEEARESGELRADLPPKFIRQSLLGAIEQVAVSAVVFDRPLDPDRLAPEICRIFFQGIQPRSPL